MCRPAALQPCAGWMCSTPSVWVSPAAAGVRRTRARASDGGSRTALVQRHGVRMSDDYPGVPVSMCFAAGAVRGGTSGSASPTCANCAWANARAVVPCGRAWRGRSPQMRKAKDLPRGVDALAHPTRADQLLGSRKAGDVADHILDLPCELLQCVQVVLSTQLLQRWPFDRSPPTACGDAKEVAQWWNQLGALRSADQAPAMGNQTAHLAHMHGWCPDRRDEGSGEQFSHRQGIPLVGLDWRGDLGVQLARISNDAPRHEGREYIVEIPGIGGGFET